MSLCHADRTVDLCGAGWTLTGVWPFATDLGQCIEQGLPFRGVTERIPAQVPGGVHQDLLRAGLIEDPDIGLNSLRCEWVENKWWIYEKDFIAPELLEGERLFLRFEGLDYHSRIYLDRTYLGRHDSMFLPVEFDITGKVDGSNPHHLTVLIEESPREVALGYTSHVTTQKPRFQYKWDFSTRLVNVGIWSAIQLIRIGRFRLLDVRIRTDFQEGKGIVDVHANLACECEPALARVVVRLLDPQGEPVAQQSCQGTPLIVDRFVVTDSELWYPLGHGDQPLYQVSIEVFDGLLRSDFRNVETGIRHLAYRKNPGSPADALPYTLVVNGCPVYAHGVNLVPFDHLYGSVTDDDYRTYVRLLVDAHVNLVRIWGGGLIEKEIFYDLCDLNGILIWQEFIQSGSGIENVPPVDSPYLDLLERHAEWAVKARRNHVSLVVWCGGNELRAEPKSDTPVDTMNANIALLERIVRTFDEQRLFLPSSASGPVEFVNEPGGHDVHGLWRYAGVEKHYALYDGSDALFHGEFGVDAMASCALARYVTGEAAPVVRSTEESPQWRFHAEWWDNLSSNQTLFGRFESLAQFIACSQLMQGEGLRYIVEADRRRAPRNSGSLVWQFNEPWPNLSCTSLVDHLGIPKGGFYFLRRAYADIDVSLRYETITPALQEEREYTVFVSTFHIGGGRNVRIGHEVLDLHGAMISERYIEVALQEDRAQELYRFRLLTPHTEGQVFFIRVFHEEEGTRYENVYFFSSAEIEPFSAMRFAVGTLQVEREGRTFRIENIGDTVAAYVHPVFDEGGCTLDDAWFCLFPREKRAVHRMDASVAPFHWAAVNPLFIKPLNDFSNEDKT